LQFGDLLRPWATTLSCRKNRPHGFTPAKAHVEARDQTVFGTPRYQATAHAAQPDHDPRHARSLSHACTGRGSVYFLALVSRSSSLRDGSPIDTQVRLIPGGLTVL